MILKNNTYCDYIAVINEKEYPLDKKESINIDAQIGANITIKSTKKDSIHLDIIALILGVFSGDDTVTFVNTDYHFTVENDCECITIIDNKWNPRTQIGIYSCYADSNVTNECYTMPNIKKTRKKHRLIHLFFSSALPIELVLIILCFLTDPPYLFVILFILLFVWFTLPSFKEIKRFKKITESNYINTKLCEYANERRNNGKSYDEDMSKTGKFVGKILNKMFKFDED